MGGPTTANVPKFCILSSLRWDPILQNASENNFSTFYLLPFHRQRLLSAVRHFHEHGEETEGRGQWEGTIRLLQDPVVFERQVADGILMHDLTEPLRVRIMLPIPSNEEPLVNVQASPTLPVEISTIFPRELPAPPTSSSPNDWTICFDTAPTTPSALTSYKTTHRNHYEISRSRSSLPPLGAPNSYNEVILYNPDGEVMEGSFTSLYFRRNGNWVTPTLKSGGCEATVRRWLLEKGLVEEDIVLKDEIKTGDWVILSNGVRGVWGAWVV
ncbi:aminotransferase [Peziza echinospora]|nr:aminotransferase [Peziza echinospora]